MDRAQSDKRALVGTHLQPQFDTALVTAEFARSLTGQFPTDRTLLLVRENEGLTFEPAQDVARVASDMGEIPPTALPFLDHGSDITLIGGYAGQCHERSFRDIAQAVAERGLANVTIRMPYDGCYVGLNWRQSADRNRTYGIDGQSMVMLELWGQQKSSFTIAEVGKHHYDTESTPPESFAYVRLKRDKAGAPLLTNSIERDAVLFEIYFKNYLEPPHGPLSETFRWPSCAIFYDGDGLQVVLNPDDETRQRYRENVLSDTDLLRYPLVSAEWLKEAAARRADSGLLLTRYFRAIARSLNELPLPALTEYATLYREQNVPQFEARFRQAIANRRLSDAIEVLNPQDVHAAVQDGAAPGALDIHFHNILASEKALEVLEPLLPHLQSHQVARAWERAVFLGNVAATKTLLPFAKRLGTREFTAWHCDSPLVTAWRNRHSEVFDLLIEQGLSPYEVGSDKHDTLLGLVAVFDDEESLQQLMKRIPFRTADVLKAKAALQAWNVEATVQARKGAMMDAGLQVP